MNTPLQAAQAGWIEAVSDAFHARHKQLYSYAVPGEPVEIIHARLKAQGIVVVKKPTPISTQTAAQTSRKVRQRSVWFAGYSEPIETPVFERAGLRPGSKLSGPAIIEETSSTSVLPPEVTAYVDARENLILNLENPQSQ